MKVLVLGSSGLLGSTLTPWLAARGHEVAAHGRGPGVPLRADLADPDAADALLGEVSPEVVVNLVGLTDVDRCEELPQQAYLANVRSVENVTRWIRRAAPACHLIQVSTDHIYAGGGPSAEHQVTLTNCYAFSKYAGELAAATVASTILRTNFFGRSRCAAKQSLTDWLFQALIDGKRIHVFDDILFSPLSMATLTEMIELAIRRRPVGVFNLGAGDGASKADFGFAFAGALALATPNMTRTTTDKVSFLKTRRPKDMRMDCAKFEHALGIMLPSLRSEIMRAAEDYRDVA